MSIKPSKRILQIYYLTVVLLFCLLKTNNSYAQKTLTSEEALKQDLKLRNSHNTEIRTHPIEYINLHFQRLDLIPRIHHDHVYVLNFYYHSGYNFRILEQHRESINLYKEYLAYYNSNKSLLSDEIKQRHISWRSFSHRSLAVAYQNLNLLDSANFEHQKNLKFTDTLNSIYKPAAINDYGMFLYDGMKSNKLALDIFKEAYNLTKKNFPEHFLLGSICDNMAIIYSENNELNVAKQLYKENFKFYKNVVNETYKVVDAYLLVKTGAKLLEIELKQNNLKEAEQAYKQLLNAYETYKSPNKKQETRLEFLLAKQQYLTAIKKPVIAYEVLTEAKYLSDSLKDASLNKSSEMSIKISEHGLNRIKSNFLLEKEQKESELSNQKLKLWIISIISISLLGFLSSLFLRRRQHIINAKNKQLIAEQDLKLTALKNEQLNFEIQSKQRDLSDFAINLTQNQEWAKVLADKLSQLRDTKGRERKKLFDEFEHDIHSKIKFDNETQDFYERLDKLSDSFYSVLHKKYPNLTKTETRLCSLIRLKIDSHAIANLQNISLSSLNTSRYRLRKKLNLSENDDLDEFIQFL